ncbi:MAG: leucyl aminopeptidase [Patescibacteria group bacterium]
MKIQCKKGRIEDTSADVLLVGCLEGEKIGGALGDLDAKLGGEIADAIHNGEFSGKKNTVLTVRCSGRLKARHIVVLGLGRKKDLNCEVLREAVGLGVKIARGLKATSVAGVAIGCGAGGIDVRGGTIAMTEAMRLAEYSFDGWKTKTKDSLPRIKEAVIVEADAKKMKNVEFGVIFGSHSSEAAILARNLVNESAFHMKPRDLKMAAEKIAKNSKRVSIKVYDREGARKLGMNAFLAVAQGSLEAPYFIHLVYKPAKKTKRKIVLVGKGITFDSGGLSLKPSAAMETMKCDMAGAASVLGVFSEIDWLSPHCEVHGLIAACENMPSGSAYRPGDVVRAKNGTTIEVLNTDAEGRVTLADSLSYAVSLKPDIIIDLATLTGACVVALGEEIAGLMTNTPSLRDSLTKAADESGEKFWELPLFDGYNKVIESKIADVKNTGNSWGGALTAGLFLKKFVGDTTWMHLDIAGPAFAERDYCSYIPLGGTGFAVRTLLRFL